MTKETLKQEAEECMHNILFWLNLSINKENIEKGGSYILKLLEPREKEISELREQNIKDCESFNKTMKEIKEQWNKEHYQLIKAKEIIRKYYKYNPSCDYSYEDIDKKAEQFLKEIK